MADVTDLFKKQKINLVKVGTIAAHVNNLIQNDEEYEELFQADPIGCLMQYGLSRKISTYMIAEAKLAKELTVTVKTALKTCPEETKVDLCVKIATKVNLCESVVGKCIPQKTMTPVCLTLKTLCCPPPPPPTNLLTTCCPTKIPICFTNTPPCNLTCFTTRNPITTKCPTWDFLKKFPKIDDTTAWNKIALGKL